MKEYLTEEGIRAINQCLQNGNDCRIQLTPQGYRIVEDKIHVVLKVPLKNTKEN